MAQGRAHDSDRARTMLFGGSSHEPKSKALTLTPSLMAAALQNNARMTAADALKLGFIDSIKTVDKVLQRACKYVRPDEKEAEVSVLP